MTSDPQIDPSLAVDLGEKPAEPSADEKLLAAAAEARAAADINDKAQRWDKAMRRAFKGIQPRPAMRAALSRANFDR